MIRELSLCAVLALGAPACSLERDIRGERDESLRTLAAFAPISYPRGALATQSTVPASGGDPEGVERWNIWTGGARMVWGVHSEFEVREEDEQLAIHGLAAADDRLPRWEFSLAPQGLVFLLRSPGRLLVLQQDFYDHRGDPDSDSRLMEGVNALLHAHGCTGPFRSLPARAAPGRCRTCRSGALLLAWLAAAPDSGPAWRAPALAHWLGAEQRGDARLFRAFRHWNICDGCEVPNLTEELAAVQPALQACARPASSP